MLPPFTSETLMPLFPWVRGRNLAWSYSVLNSRSFLEAMEDLWSPLCILNFFVLFLSSMSHYLCKFLSLEYSNLASILFLFFPIHAHCQDSGFLETLTNCIIKEKDSLSEFLLPVSFQVLGSGWRSSPTHKILTHRIWTEMDEGRGDSELHVK